MAHIHRQLPTVRELVVESPINAALVNLALVGLPSFLQRVGTEWKTLYQALVQGGNVTDYVYKLTFGGRFYGTDNEEWQNNIHVVATTRAAGEDSLEVRIEIADKLANNGALAYASLLNSQVRPNINGLANVATVALKSYMTEDSSLDYCRAVQVVWAYSSAANHGTGGWQWTEVEETRSVVELTTPVFGTGPSAGTNQPLNSGAPQISKCLSFITDSRTRRARFGRIYVPLSLLEADPYGRTNKNFNQDFVRIGNGFINALQVTISDLDVNWGLPLLLEGWLAVCRPVVLSRVSAISALAEGVVSGERANTEVAPVYADIEVIRSGDVLDSQRRRRKQIREEYTNYGEMTGGISGAEAVLDDGIVFDPNAGETFTSGGVARVGGFVTGSNNQNLIFEEVQDSETTGGLDDVNSLRYNGDEVIILPPPPAVMSVVDDEEEDLFGDYDSIYPIPYSF